MRLGVLFSGGKDSCFAMLKAMEEHEIACLITIASENKESFMFHTPNISLTKMQAESMDIPLIYFPTKGEKEKELGDLEKAILLAKEKYKIEGIVTGAVKSVYQASRVQRICKKVGLWCFNPLWLMDEIELLRGIVESGIGAVLSGVFAFPIDKSFLGKTIDSEMIAKLSGLKDKYKINPAGEGGEIETTVLDAPFFRERINITDSDIQYKNYSGVFEIKKAEMVKK
jgi:diphthine-ammonia ligase